MMEKTLVLIKPDAVERNYIGKILSIYEDNNLKITDLKMLTCSEELARKHYAEHLEKPFFPDLLKYITRGPLVALILEGEDAISRVRKLHGPADPNKAVNGTIRKLYATSGTENAVHASDSLESAERELSIWF